MIQGLFKHEVLIIPNIQNSIKNIKYTMKFIKPQHIWSKINITLQEVDKCNIQMEDFDTSLNY